MSTGHGCAYNLRSCRSSFCSPAMPASPARGEFWLTARDCGCPGVNTSSTGIWTLPSKYLPGKVWQGLSRLALYRDHRSGAASVMAIPSKRWRRSAVRQCSGVLRFWQQLEIVSVGYLLPLSFSACPQPPCCVRVRWAQSSTPLRAASGFPRPPAVSRRVLAAVLIWQAVGYLLMIAAYVLVVAAIGFDGLAILPSLAGALLLSGVAGLLAIVVPAGVGVRDAAFAWIIVGVVPAQTAVMLSLLSRVWLIAGDIFAFVVAAALRAVTARHR